MKEEEVVVVEKEKKCFLNLREVSIMCNVLKKN